MTSKQWQLANDAANRYEKILVPAILGPFAEALVDWANLQGDITVVDVGCGTGAAARFAAGKLTESGKVIGTDVNPAMLKVAQSLPTVQGAPIEYRQESAYDLSMKDETADAVLCAQTLQFLENRQQALGEMRRIVKTGQPVYVSLWCEIEQSPYFDALVSAIAEHISPDTAAGLGTAFNLSKLDEIETVLHTAGFTKIEATITELELSLPPIADFVPRHIQATPMGTGYNAASEATQQKILDQLSELLSKYQTEIGMQVPFRSHLIRAAK